jgi:putative hydrolase of the HAD superfamily
MVPRGVGIAALTFDFGQTLTELDCDLLAERLAERGIEAAPADLQRAVPDAWRSYDRELKDGRPGHPWQLLMRVLLCGAGVDEKDARAVVPWLFEQQRVRNLWRAPIPGMIELVREVRQQVPVGVISNSEGKLFELTEELGWQDDFDVIADSGKLGFEKPGARIFQWTAERLRVSLDEIVHVGDSWSADVLGATAQGARAIWFGGASAAPEPPESDLGSERVSLCRSAAEVRQALARWGLSLSQATDELS